MSDRSATIRAMSEALQETNGFSNRQAALIAAASAVTAGSWRARREAMLEYAEELVKILDTMDAAEASGTPITYETAWKRS